MEPQFSEEALWATGLASRLRLIQANFADDPSSVRQGYLVEEIERAIKPVAPSRRQAYLDSLAERFPAWDGVRSSSKSDVEVGAARLTPETLVSKLVEVAPSLSPETRAAFAAQLQTAGLVVKESAEPSADLNFPPELLKRMGLTPDKPLQLEKAKKLLMITTELALALDQLAWALWRQLAPKSLIKRETEFNRLAGSYLSGDAEVSTTQLAQPIERTRKLINALLNAVGLAGRYFAKEFGKQLAPEVIEDTARMEKRALESLEAAIGRVFIRTAKEHASEVALEHQIREAMVKAATEIYEGRRAAG